MNRATNRVVAHARENGGVITRPEAIALGLPSSTLSRLASQGLLVRVRPGVFALPGLTNDHLIDLHAACRRLGAVVSHQSAAMLWGLDRPKNVKPTVTVPRRRTKDYEGVMVHQLTDLVDDHIEIRDGLPITVVERTVIDLAAVLPQGHLERIVDRALAAGLLDIESLARLFEQLARKGKPGTARMRTILAARQMGYGTTDSELERRLLKVIVESDLPEPTKQFRPEWLRPTNGRVDFAYPEFKLIIEGDSRRWHLLMNSFEIDRQRDNSAQIAGWRVLRFTWRQIIDEGPMVGATIRSALRMSGFDPYTGRHT